MDKNKIRSSFEDEGYTVRSVVENRSQYTVQVDEDISESDVKSILSDELVGVSVTEYSLENSDDISYRISLRSF